MTQKIIGRAEEPPAAQDTAPVPACRPRRRPVRDRGRAELAAGTAGFFELDKNATNDLTVSHLGALKSQIRNADRRRRSRLRARADAADRPGAAAGHVGTTILIDAEQMVITDVGAASNKTGGCSFSDPADTVADVRTYTVTRGANGTTAPSHPGGADVSTLIAGPDKPGTDWSDVYTEYNGALERRQPVRERSLTRSRAPGSSDPPGQSVFTGGSADTLDIPGWHWTDMSVPDADEILHAYAIKFCELRPVPLLRRRPLRRQRRQGHGLLVLQEPGPRGGERHVRRRRGQPGGPPGRRHPGARDVHAGRHR